MNVRTYRTNEGASEGTNERASERGIERTNERANEQANKLASLFSAYKDNNARKIYVVVQIYAWFKFYIFYIPFF